MTTDLLHISPQALECLLWAAELHAGQTDLAGRPYREHILAVALGVAERGFSGPAISAAALHDAAEDGKTTLDEIARRAGLLVAGAVGALTRRPGEAYEAYLARVLSEPMAAEIKVQDLIHNSQANRLAALPAETAERLRRKYAAALSKLAHAVGMGKSDLLRAGVDPSLVSITTI